MRMLCRRRRTRAARAPGDALRVHPLADHQRERGAARPQRVAHDVAAAEPADAALHAAPARRPPAQQGAF